MHKIHVDAGFATGGYVLEMARSNSRKSKSEPRQWRNRIVGSGEEDPEQLLATAGLDI